MAASAWWPLVLAVGFVASILGALAGLGGGFIAVPLLRFGGLKPEWAALTSLIMVCANAASASIAYARQGRIDSKAAWLMASTGIPASIAGAFAVRLVSARGFDLLLAGAQIIIAVYLLRRSRITPVPVEPGPGTRTLVDRAGSEYRYLDRPGTLLLTGAAAGAYSSFFGVGVGLVVAPVLIGVLRVPAHVAVATTSLLLLLTAPIGVLAHVGFERQPLPHYVLTLGILLAAGGLAGGQAGARLAPRVKPKVLTFILAVMILCAAAGLIARHVPGILR